MTQRRDASVDAGPSPATRPRPPRPWLRSRPEPAAGGTPGLWALYFVLAGSVDRFAYLKPGIAILLVFIGAKMLTSPLVHLPTWVNLAVTAAVAGGAVAASLWRDR